MEIFSQRGTEKWGWGLEYLPKRGSRDGNRVKIDSPLRRIPARGLISIPIPVGGGDFSLMRGGAPMGAGKPGPVAIPNPDFGALFFLLCLSHINKSVFVSCDVRSD